MFNNISNSLNAVTVNICQVLAMLVILTGIIKALLIYIKDVLFKKESVEAITESRLEIGHSFSLGLAFLIGASILKTILAPTWNDIGQLASIIAIRTILNYFLLADVKKLHQDNDEEQEPDKDAPPSATVQS